MFTPPVDSSGERVPPAALHGVLASETRRHVLDYFERDIDGTATLDELADHVRSRRNGDPVRSPEETRVRLRHADLPKLAAVGVIDYDAETDTVRHHGHSRLVRTEGGWDVVSGDREAEEREDE